ncbi:MAG: immunoglobulin domain-containing protein [Verrucomicrobia bacterium]|nr:immunoglobulin domain-containing protein [Verrucomicrobiota bacterium]
MNNWNRIQAIWCWARSGISATTLAGVLLSTCPLPSSLRAGTFTVTSTNATGPGSLPVIITQANAAAGDQTINFAVGGTILLPASLPTVTNNLTLNGPANNPVTISGGRGVAILTLAAGTTNVLNQISFANANTGSGGAAVNNAGTLFVNNCQFAGCGASGSGGAISNAGTMTIVGSAFSGNQAAAGGAIYNAGSMTIADSQLLDNQAGNGGAIYNAGNLDLERLTISSNLATLGFGGGVFNSGILAISASTVSDNSANGGAGGTGSHALGFAGGGGGAGLGGGVYNDGSALALTNCTLFANWVRGGAGANGGQGGWMFLQPSYGGNGGGNNAGLGSISGGPLRAATPGGFGGGGGGGLNGAGLAGGAGGFGGGGGGGGTLGTAGGPAGGFGGGGGGEMYNAGGGGGGGLGGGLFVRSGNVELVNCTLTANGSTGGAGSVGPDAVYSGPNGPETGSPGQGIGGGIFNYQGTVSLLNTIVAGNSATNSSPDLYGPVVTSGVNLIGNNQGASGLSLNDFQNVSAGLGPLENNGGATLTCALLQGSLAIDTGTSLGAPTVDQRGVPRPTGQVDIGAFQVISVITPTITWSNPADIVYGTPLGTNQLNAAVGVEGALTFTPPIGTILSAGSNQVLSVGFNPSDLTRYTAATSSVMINVLKADQNISFAAIPHQNIGDPPIVLTATASSGLPVSFSLVSGPATVTGNLLSLGTVSGAVTVEATQAGNTNFNPAPGVDQTFVLGTLPLPVITTQPVGQTVNPGDRVTFNVVATNGPLSYQWLWGGTPVTGATASSLVLARVQASQAGPYDVIVSNASGSVTSTVAMLVVNISAGTPAITSQPQSLVVRAGEVATFGVTATGAAQLQYQWYQGQSGEVSTPISGATNATFTVASASTNTAYWVSVSNPLGSVDSGTAFLTVAPTNAAKLGLRLISGLPALSLDGLVGTVYRIEFSTNLASTNWTKIIDLSLPSTPYTYIDSAAENGTLRFYRVVAP